MPHGFYSLIQYVPDSERAEGANVGVLVFSPQVEPQIVAVHSARPPHLRELCKQPPNDRELGSLMRSLAQRLRNDAPSDLPTFIKALGREAGKLRAITPRAVPVTDLHTTASELCQRLVGEAQTRDRTPKKIPEIEALRNEPGMAQVIRPNVTVPLAGRVLQASYEWVNGKPNVVVNTRLRDDNTATDTAIQWGGKGHLLRDNPADGISRQLAVVTTIDSKVSPRVREHIAAVFREFHVEWVRPDTMDEYIARIRREAHPVEDV